ncbi:helix-turn-helix transcriptional regulator [Metabacillus sp. FJAT-53654]|uniref:Helix-turn-helix domain-containing protein n=1 Tax=Metabacillus rhizosphaerae TaxID=3117747 RepID=A0ABZ2MYD0_9BACI
MKIECKLRDFLNENGIKQKFIAEKAEISQGTLSLIIRGESLPTLPVAYKIAGVVNKPIEEIWVRVDE